MTISRVVSYDSVTTTRVVSYNLVTTNRVVSYDPVKTTRVVSYNPVTTTRVVSYDLVTTLTDNSDELLSPSFHRLQEVPSITTSNPRPSAEQKILLTSPYGVYCEHTKNKIQNVIHMVILTACQNHSCKMSV